MSLPDREPQDPWKALYQAKRNRRLAEEAAFGIEEAQRREAERDVFDEIDVAAWRRLGVKP